MWRASPDGQPAADAGFMVRHRRHRSRSPASPPRADARHGGDANILIYERLARRARPRRQPGDGPGNGYDPRLPTDHRHPPEQHLHRFVLYMVGTIQLKGFGISLPVGLIISLFTSLYVTRRQCATWPGKKLADEAEHARLFSKPNIDFMRIRYYCSRRRSSSRSRAALFIYRDKSGLTSTFVRRTATRELDRSDGHQRSNHFLKGSDLADLSVEQIFISAPGYTEGTKSKLFTVRTSEKDRKKVLDEINRTLGKGTRTKKRPELLKTIDLHDYQPVFARESLRRDLSFVDRESKQTRLRFARHGQHVFDAADAGSSRRAGRDNQDDRRRLSRRCLANDRRWHRQGQGRPFPVDGIRFRWTLAARPRKETNDRSQRSRATCMSCWHRAKKTFGNNPQPERLENFDSQLAAETQLRALYAILASWGRHPALPLVPVRQLDFGAAAVCA